MITGTGGPLTHRPEHAVRDARPAKQMTVFMAGRNEAHTRNPQLDRALAQRQLDVRDLRGCSSRRARR